MVSRYEIIRADIVVIYNCFISFPIISFLEAHFEGKGTASECGLPLSMMLPRKLKQHLLCCLRLYC